MSAVRRCEKCATPMELLFQFYNCRFCTQEPYRSMQPVYGYVGVGLGIAEGWRRIGHIPAGDIFVPYRNPFPYYMRGVGYFRVTLTYEPTIFWAGCSQGHVPSRDLPFTVLAPDR